MPTPARPARSSSLEETTMNDSTRARRRRTAGMAARGANRGRDHRHGQPRPAGGGIAAAAAHPPLPAHRMRERQRSTGRRTPRRRSRTLAACARTACRTSPTPPAAERSPRSASQQLGVSSSQFQAAERACQRLLPAGTDDQFPPGEVQQLLIGMLRFSQCMRSHGVPNWPDPTTDSEGRPIFPLPAAGISRQQARSPRVTHAGDECQHLLPAALGGIPVG